jgi:hypothetical protein
MTNIELWHMLCGALGVDPCGLTITPLDSNRQLCPDSREMPAGKRANDIEGITLFRVWLSTCMTWSAQPQGNAYWQGFREFVGKLDGEQSPLLRKWPDGLRVDDAEGIRQAARRYSASRL